MADYEEDTLSYEDLEEDIQEDDDLVEESWTDSYDDMDAEDWDELYGDEDEELDGDPWDLN